MGIWGFIAGLSDYFIRSALTMPTTTTTTSTTTTATTAATTTSMRRRNKNKTKKNKNKGKKADRTVEVLEAEPIPDVEPLKMKIDEDSMKSEDMAPETVEQETVEA